MGDIKVGDRVKDRTVIRVIGQYIVFGRRERNIDNCGAYVTDFEEWFDYKNGRNP